MPVFGVVDDDDSSLPVIVIVDVSVPVKVEEISWLVSGASDAVVEKSMFVNVVGEDDDVISSLIVLVPALVVAVSVTSTRIVVADWVSVMVFSVTDDVATGVSNVDSTEVISEVPVLGAVVGNVMEEKYCVISVAAVVVSVVSSLTVGSLVTESLMVDTSCEFVVVGSMNIVVPVTFSRVRRVNTR